MIWLLHVLAAKVILTLKKDVLLHPEIGSRSRLEAVPCIVGMGPSDSAGDWCTTVATIVDSQVIVEGALERSRVVHGSKSTSWVWDVGVPSTSIVCVVDTLGVNRWELISCSLFCEIESACIKTLRIRMNATLPSSSILVASWGGQNPPLWRLM